jgi:hypothetical protein
MLILARGNQLGNSADLPGIWELIGEVSKLLGQWCHCTRYVVDEQLRNMLDPMGMTQ